MTVLVRPARPEDGPALVRLRLANGERHAELAPARHRVPEPEAVRRHFDELLADPGRADVVILVAEVSGAVAGMSELVMSATPPDHQILVPRRSAQVHTVVLLEHRGQGVGRALVAAAEREAARRGVTELIAPILASNAGAIGFYVRAGFGSHGILLAKELNPDGDPT